METKPEALKAVAQRPRDETPSAVQAELLTSGDAEETLAVSDSNTAPQAETALPQTPADQTPGAVRRQARFEQVHAVYAATGSMREVARQLKMSRRAVRRYLNAEQCLSYPKERIRHSKLFPYLKRLEERWQAGCTNTSQLWRDLQAEGFTGSRGLVARWTVQQRQHLPKAMRCQQR